MAAPSTDKQLYKIGEVCKVADVQPYVLRYWETEFPPLTPNKSGGGQRLYTQREIDVILRIKQLLYSEGFTIAGAKKKLEVEIAGGGVGVVAVPPAVDTAAPSEASPAPKASRGRKDASSKALVKVKKDLAAILELLRD